MPNKTGIEWADYSSNPVRAQYGSGPYQLTGGHPLVKKGHACVKVSEGCAHCWASMFNVRLGTGLEYTRPNLSKIELLLEEAELARLGKFQPRGPFKNGRDRALVFLGDMTDLFGDWVPFEFQQRIFRTLAERPEVDFMLLTKRPERMLDFVAGSVPLNNVILGTSVENQKRADERGRVMHSLHFRGWKTAVSYEPALDLVDWAGWYFLDWMICGGESGNQARPMAAAWARSARDFCRAWHIPFFFKQWGEWAPVADLVERGMTTFKQRPLDGMVKVGKGLAGHLLDGQEWRQVVGMTEAE
jgi:protein gp37